MIVPMQKWFPILVCGFALCAPLLSGCSAPSTDAPLQAAAGTSGMDTGNAGTSAGPGAAGSPADAAGPGDDKDDAGIAGHSDAALDNDAAGPNVGADADAPKPPLVCAPPLPPQAGAPIGPDGYVYCAKEGEVFRLSALSNVAFGAAGSFRYLRNKVGTITFDSDFFGGDPSPDATKAGFCQVITNVETEEFSAALQQLTQHLSGAAPLTAAELQALGLTLRQHLGAAGANAEVIAQAFAVVDAYEASSGPLFIGASSKGGFPRAPASDGNALDRVMFILQQGLLDYAFTAANLEQHLPLLGGKNFRTSQYFPGAVAAPENPAASHAVQINASQPEVWGSPVLYSKDSARRPTGLYLAPGSVATVTVPEDLIGKGFAVRVGAHSWDLLGKPTIKRLDRVTTVFPIQCTRTRVANPLGGGIYIEVPYLAAEGVVSVQIENAVRAPFFSAKSSAKTSLEEWQTTERTHTAPWADFESDKFMMQVPTGWIADLDDPVSLMQDWDLAMDAVSELFGLPLVRNKTVLYLQIDVIFRGTANFPGYPQSNYPYNPNNIAAGKSHFSVRGPQFADWTVLHELGHAQSFTKFAGESESAVNLLYVAAMNKKFGRSLDVAFGNSIGARQELSLDRVATDWMVRENFRAGNPMNISNQPGDEVKYQHRGHGKYVEVANLFGWDALGAFWHSVHLDYQAGTSYPTNTDPIDSRILRMSKAAGVDLTPLIHFWGVHPVNGNALKANIAAEGLLPSRAIYDRLLHYRSLIPLTNQQFRDHASDIYPGNIGMGDNALTGVGWYYVWLPLYGAAEGEAAVAALQAIIDRYFPNGRPPA